jgi:hypothetical protein
VDSHDEPSVEQPRDTPDSVERNKPTQRLLAVIAYKTGVTETELAECHDTGRRTTHTWLMRPETDEQLAQAIVNINISIKRKNIRK